MEGFEYEFLFAKHFKISLSNEELQSSLTVAFIEFKLQHSIFYNTRRYLAKK